MAGAKGRIIIRPRLMEFLTLHAGEQLFVGDLATRFACAEKQIQECMQAIVRQESMPGLTVVIPSRSWIYRPNRNASNGDASTVGRRMFEELAQTKAGDLIIQDQDGHLWRAKELE